MEIMCGALAFENEIGKGTIFTMFSFCEPDYLNSPLWEMFFCAV
jgi:hypothetical protein